MEQGSPRCRSVPPFCQLCHQAVWVPQDRRHRGDEKLTNGHPRDCWALPLLLDLTSSAHTAQGLTSPPRSLSVPVCAETSHFPLCLLSIALLEERKVEPSENTQITHTHTKHIPHTYRHITYIIHHTYYIHTTSFMHTQNIDTQSSIC